ncbi:hypothetical protein F3Y22_tig00110885pilonHSYRG00037 [Hibiscus syriacus]|uniref:Aminotransferase-like plant mobile domain-containing protein n=1 Tax=Hibiscus syriacus TaxID=106335 RepID=A0A6A2ZI20_HIBSY|nr:hypothetical protein F3Y22_tig00110885pilonHSYRG00037 [Hibiscus syriacus]
MHDYFGRCCATAWTSDRRNGCYRLQLIGLETRVSKLIGCGSFGRAFGWLKSETNLVAQPFNITPKMRSWAWYRLPFLAPRTATAPVYPLAARWNSRKVHTGIQSGLASIRVQLDRLEYEKNTNTALICFAIVAWHQTDRVMRQFGMQQSIPEMPMNFDKLHKIDMDRHHDEPWPTKHKEWIELWYMCSQKIPHGYPIVGNDFKPSDEYRRWYMDEGKPFVCPISESEDVRSKLCS